MMSIKLATASLIAATCLAAGSFPSLACAEDKPTAPATPAAKAPEQSRESKPATVAVDSAIKGYTSTPGVSGTLNSVGSDSMNNLMTYWAEGFNRFYPSVKVQIEAKGSSTAPTALIAGTAQLGPMSRKMKAEEMDKFEKKFGYKPTEIKVAVDGLAIFVHKDNPIKSLSLQQADAIFSATNKRGGAPVNTWGELGLTGDWTQKPISLYGRNSASGTYGFFKEHTLKGGDYRPSVKEQPGSSAVVQSISSDLGGIGYSGIGYSTSGVKAVWLSDSDGTAYEPSYENCLDGTYPLARFLYVYVNKDPKKPLDKLTAEFVKFIASREGQEIAIKDGYFPLPPAQVAESHSITK